MIFLNKKIKYKSGLMNFKRRTIIKSLFLLPLINLGFQVKNLIKKKKFKSFIWILKDSD